MHFIKLTKKNDGRKILVNLATVYFEAGDESVCVKLGSAPIWFTAIESFEEVERLILEAGGLIMQIDKSKIDVVD